MANPQMIIVASAVMLAVLGIVFGVGLAVASKRFAVQADPLVEELDVALPQLNCGACGLAGCLAYAKAVAAGEAKVNLCIPGGKGVAEKLAAISGQELAEIKPVRACVHCQGGCDEAVDDYRYVGERDCRAAVLVQGGPKLCKYGCLGFGTCVRVCPYGAITMDEDRLPLIDFERCTGCGLCVKACPVRIIETLPQGTKVYLGCSSLDRGAVVRKKCSVGCISCRLCARTTTSGAITMEKEDALPKVHHDVQGETFEAAFQKCPMHCYVKTTGTRSVDYEAQKAVREPKKKPVEAAAS